MLQNGGAKHAATKAPINTSEALAASSGRKSQRLMGAKKGLASSTASDSSASHTVTVSFIQVCCNYLRGYCFDWAGLYSQAFLQQIYESGNAFYVCAGCPIIDMAASIKIAKVSSDIVTFAPLCASFKSHVYFAPSEAAEECARMKAAVEGVHNDFRKGVGALCLLVVFGSSVDSNDNELTLDASAVHELVDGNIVTRVLRIPTDDIFEISKSFLHLTGSTETTRAESFASHPYIRGYANDTEQQELLPDFALRSGVKNCDKQNFASFANELKKTSTLGAGIDLGGNAEMEGLMLSE